MSQGVLPTGRRGNFCCDRTGCACTACPQGPGDERRFRGPDADGDPGRGGNGQGRARFSGRRLSRARLQDKPGGSHVRRVRSGGLCAFGGKTGRLRRDRIDFRKPRVHRQGQRSACEKRERHGESGKPGRGHQKMEHPFQDTGPHQRIRPSSGDGWT